MLTHVHVKNLALIDEAEVDFSPGLNILTGETGAGKSILIGAVGMALGQKVSREAIREGADFALAELVFQLSDPVIIEELSKMGVETEDGQVIVSRRLNGTRGICKINGEICTAARVRQAAEVLLDIHGQQEHQSLLKTNRQLEYLDAFGKDQIYPLLDQTAELYRAYRATRKEYETYSFDEEQRKREMDFLEFEINEIEEAALRPGEDEELENRYRRMANSKKITSALYQVHEMIGYEEDDSVGSLLGKALHSLSGVSSYDENLGPFMDTLSDIESLVGDLTRELSSYLSELTFSEEEFAQLEERLDLINHLKEKYGNSVEKILSYADIKQKELDKLKNYEVYKEKVRKTLDAQEKKLTGLCGELNRARKTCAAQFEKQLISHLKDLNFADVRFAVRFEALEHFTEKGMDAIEFQISTNPGEPIRPLASVVSGGELSRIMLAIRTLLAWQDHTETLIFDEIDTGISGRTAQKVSEKMAVIGKNCQVICITHLPQIAAMADSHYEIVKLVENQMTHTKIRALSREASCLELARMLGGTEITDRVKENALEMRTLAETYKKALV